MNKGITMLILAVILLAMGMVTFFHLQGGRRDAQAPAAPENSTRAPLQAQAPAHNATGAPPAATPSQNASASPAITAPAPNATERAELPLPKMPPPINAPEESRPAMRQADDKKPAEPAPQTGEANAAPAKKPSAPAKPANGQKTEKTVKEVAEKQIESIRISFSGQKMLLRIVGNAPLKARYFVLDNPDRLVVDLPGKWKNISAPSVPSNRIIKGARLGRHGDSERLVLDLSGKPQKDEAVTANPQVLEIYIQ